MAQRLHGLSLNKEEIDAPSNPHLKRRLKQNLLKTDAVAANDVAACLLLKLSRGLRLI